MQIARDSLTDKGTDRMEQNGNGNQNGQGNYQGINNTPDNPYTEYYQQYIVTPEQKKKEVSKPKRVGSMILCTLSDMFMLSFSVMWAVFLIRRLPASETVI